MLDIPSLFLSPSQNPWTPWSRVLLKKLTVTQPVKFFRRLWNSKFRYRVQRSLPVDPILSHIHPVHNFVPYFPKIHSNNIFPSTPLSSEWCLPFRVSEQNFVLISRLSHACCMPRLFHRHWLDDANNIWWSIGVIKLLIMQSSPHSRHFPPLRSKHSPRHPVLTHNLCSSLSVRDQDSHPFPTHH
jgi:hypothetical protein